MAAFALPKIPAITTLSSRVIRFLGCNPSPMTLQGTNSYLIGSGKDRLLIDTSSPGMTQYVDNVAKVLRESELRISAILLTHWHPDHIGCVEDIQEMCSKVTRHTPQVYKFDSSHLTVPSLPILDGQKFSLDAGATTLVAMETPGHSHDHVAFYLPEERRLFCGDVLLGHGSTTISDLGAYLGSLERLKASAEQYDTICSSHGELIEDPSAKIDEYLDHRQQRIDQVHEALVAVKGGDWMTEMDILACVYPGLNEMLIPAALSNQRQALHYLQSRGLIESRPAVNDVDSFDWRNSSTKSKL